MSYRVSYNKDSPFLQHYGVLGMKWGVRKKRGSSESSRKKRRREDDLSELTFEELQQKVNRLNLEKRYRDLSKEQKTAGQKFVDSAKEVFAQSSKETAKKYVTKGMEAGAEALIRKTRGR